MSRKTQSALPLEVGAGEIRVPIKDEKLKGLVTRWLGLKLAIDVLETDTLGEKLAGRSLDLRLLRLEEGSVFKRVMLIGIPLMARHGVDLSAWQMHSFDGAEAIVCSPIPDDELDDAPPAANPTQAEA